MEYIICSTGIKLNSSLITVKYIICRSKIEAQYSKELQKLNKDYHKDDLR